ncbi:MAG: C1 family peptidase [Bifidobacteriaceae bacterium]|nr:C1 family peptidase [Bifidobacteriaceae bacterium]
MTSIENTAAKGLTEAGLAHYSEAFGAQRANTVAAAAATNNGVLKAATDYRGVRALPQNFSIELEQGSITAQKHSGRCWMFSGLNVLRYEMIHRWNLKDFEFSESFLFFYDKLEKSNYFLEGVLATLDESIESRRFEWVMEDVASDGGFWDMFSGLVRKYGLVPKDASPESKNSSDSGAFTQYLQTLLRKDALELRTQAEAGKTVDELRALKAQQLEAVYRLLAISLGEPPKTFDFVMHDKDGKLLEDHGITPKQFYDKYVGAEGAGVDLDDFVSLIDSPTAATPYGKRYRLARSGNMADQDDSIFANVGMDVIKAAIVAQLKDGHPVWFACDCTKYELRDEGIFDPATVRVADLFDTDLSFDKGRSLEYRDAEGNHAMTLMGVNLDATGAPDRWKIENSWGKDVGKDGYFVASDSWFNQFVLEAIVQKKYLDEATLKVLATAPVTLDPWTNLCLKSD